VNRREPLLYFHVSELKHYWEDLCKYLAPVKVATQLPKRLRNPIASAKDAFDYLGIIPPAEITDFQKQTTKRHFGVHGYSPNRFGASFSTTSRPSRSPAT
jgi:hypothetical protein